MPNPITVTLNDTPRDLVPLVPMTVGQEYTLQNLSPGGSRVFLRMDTSTPAATAAAWHVMPGLTATISIDVGEGAYAWTEQAESCLVAIGEARP